MVDKLRMNAISIIIPVHNGAKNLESCVERIISHLKANRFASYEIMIAEDGSCDGSGSLARRMGRKLRHVKALTSKNSLGKGLAISRAIGRCKHEIVGFLDVDAIETAGSISSTAKLLARSEVVIGTRYSKGAKCSRPAYRHFLSLAYRQLVNVLFFEKFSDYQCGFKIFRKSAVVRLLPLIGSGGWFWDTALLLQAKKKGLVIAECPVIWVELDGTVGKSAQQSIELLLELARYWIGGVISGY